MPNDTSLSTSVSNNAIETPSLPYDLHSPSHNNIADINTSLQNEVRHIASTAILDFQPVGAFLFVLDPYSQLLEPLFESHQFPYEVLGAVATSYNSEQESVPARIEDAGIASVAYREAFAFSQDPANDSRFGSNALDLQTKYRITGSMMAIRLDDVLGNVLGVAVVHSQDMKKGLSQHQESRFLTRFRENLGTLRSLIEMRRAVTSAIQVSCCKQFVKAMTHCARIPRTVVRACAVFKEICRSSFAAEDLYIRVQHLGTDPEWYPKLQPHEHLALETTIAHAGSAMPFILNRSSQAPAVADSLRSAFGGSFLWSIAQAQMFGCTAICVSRRKATSILDHWQQADVTLLQMAIDLFTSQLARASHFDDLVNTLLAAAGSDDQQARFRLLVQLIRDYFGFDQVLIAKVKRKPDRYKVCTQFCDGFGPNESVTKKYHKEFTPGQTHTKPKDIMEIIVADYESGHLKYIYEESASSPNVDQRIVNACGLRGNMYFVPCCSAEVRELPSLLHSVLHVGSSDGSVRLEDDSVPLLLAFAGRIAEWLVSEQTREYSSVMREIRAIENCNTETLRGLSRKIATVTASVGCTIFIHAENLSLLGQGTCTPDGIADAMRSFVENFDLWDELFTPAEHSRLLGMFSDLFGISAVRCKTIFSDPSF